jgi:hypothetical protein
MTHSTSLRRPRRRILAVAAAAAVIATPLMLYAAQASLPATPAGWTLVFSDDFNGAANTGLNTANWLYATGTSYPGGAANWGTGEIETMTNSTANVYQDGAGHLAIKPLRDAAGNWTSGRGETQRTDFAAPSGRARSTRGRHQLAEHRRDRHSRRHQWS